MDFYGEKTWIENKFTQEIETIIILLISLENIEKKFNESIIQQVYFKEVN